MLIPPDEATGLTGTLVTLAEPWARIYSHSKAVSAAVTFLHLAPLVFGAGAAFMMDRGTVRAVRGTAAERATHLRELGIVHRLVIGGLALSFISGLLMFFSDVETFMGSIFLWIKLGLVALLLVNGFVMTRIEKRLAGAGDDAALWGRLRMLAIVSGVLWLATTLAGVVLTEYA